MGRASSAERCTSGENAGTDDCGPGAEGAGRPGDAAWFAEDVERRRLEEAGLVTESDRDERLRGAVGDCGAGEAAPTALSSRRGSAAGCGSAPDREVGEPAAALRVETVDSEADSCEIDSNDVLSESSEVSSASARLFICGGSTGSGRGFRGEPDREAHLADGVARIDEFMVVVVDERLSLAVELTDLCFDMRLASGSCSFDSRQRPHAPFNSSFSRRRRSGREAFDASS